MARPIPTRTGATSTATTEGGAHRVSPWPAAAHDAVLFLVDARSAREARLLREWVERTAPDDPRPDFMFRTIGDQAGIAARDDIWLQPIRIAGRRWLARWAPGRVHYLAGEGATLATVKRNFTEAWGESKREDGLAAFVDRQAVIVLEREERNLRGARYKVPRLLPSDVFADARFRQHLESLALQRDRDVDAVRADAERYLREMAAMQTPFTLDFMVSFMRTACRSNHDPDIGFLPEQLAEIGELMNSRTVAFAITHKSMLDTMALSLVLFDANKPLPLTFGGINMNTPGLGALARRAGVVFLRRSFQDNEIYKSTFRRYVDYLIEKRFSLLWALEGTRSRTGKLLPPRFGMFSYVVDSILRTQQHDVAFVPVTVVYDQITEVEDYAFEQRGHKKKPEGAGWFLKFLKRNKSHGSIHLRFGKPLDIRELTTPERLAAGLDAAEKQTLVQMLALEVAVRMNAATPITATAILTTILLAAGNRALSLTELHFLIRAGLRMLRRRQLEVVDLSDFKDPEAVAATLAQLHATGIVTYYDEGRERLYGIEANQHLKAAYYRNTAIHYFVLDALAEVALLEVSARRAEERRDALFESLDKMRELFKFEFYFPRRHEFAAAVQSVLDDRFSRWQEAIAGDEDEVRNLVARSRPLLAHGVLRSFADAYRVVARALTELDGAALDDRSAFVSDCLKLGRQLRLQGRVFSEESVSKTLYETALKLAAHRNLLGAGPESAAGRQELLEELRTIGRHLDDVLDFALKSVAD